MTDERFRLLIGAAVGSVAIVGICILLALKIPVEQVLAGFAAVGSVVTLFVLGEVQKVKANTNGTIDRMWQKIDDLTEYVKNSQPVNNGGTTSGRTTSK